MKDSKTNRKKTKNSHDFISWALFVVPFLALLFSLYAISAASRTEAPQTTSSNEITGKITDSGFTRLRIAVPPCRTNGSTYQRGNDALAVVKSDLSFSGFFDLVDPSLYKGMNIGRNGIDYDAWKAMNADYLLTSSLSMLEGKLVLTGQLYDIKRKELVTGKRLKAVPDDLRLMAHHLSSVILDYLFGAGSFPTSQILFTSSIGSTEEIFLCDYDGSRLTRLTAMGQLNVTPDVSPDGMHIVFTSIMKNSQELFLLDRGGHRTKLYGRGEGLNSNPAYSHDGKFVAFCSSKSGNPDLWLMDLATKRLKRLTFSWAIDTAPTWSPDDQHIAFTSDRSGRPQIYVMDRDGTNVKRLSPPGSGRSDQPAWSPRGDRIAYASLENGHFDIAVLEISTGKVNFLTHGEGNNEAPNWSPDGRYLAFTSNRSGSFQIYLMRLDGSGVKRITRQPGCYSPCWFKG